MHRAFLRGEAPCCVMAPLFSASLLLWCRKQASKRRLLLGWLWEVFKWNCREQQENTAARVGVAALNATFSNWHGHLNSQLWGRLHRPAGSSPPNPTPDGELLLYDPAQWAHRELVGGHSDWLGPQ